MLAQTNTHHILLTGATGFVGHRLLVELLRAGRRCAISVRSPERSIRTLATLLAPYEVDVREAIARERLLLIEGDLRSGLAAAPGIRFQAVLHAAASTRFAADASGDPAATNVSGTGRLLEWCERHEVRDFQQISSAYVCGQWPHGADVPEQFHGSAETPPAFHNDYEQSKWEAERMCLAWARSRSGRTATIYRPSVVVGEFASGRAAKFDGFYLPARATELLARTYSEPDDPCRWSVQLRIAGRPQDVQNIVPVDYVAAMIAHLLGDPASRGRVFHLTHPQPPTNAQIKAALEKHFRLAGGRFVDPALLSCEALTEQERLFADLARPVQHYMLDTPRFTRTHTAAAEKTAAIRCPDYDEEALRRLFCYAQMTNWHDARRRRSHGRTSNSRSACDAYFHRFLPAHVNTSRIAQITGLTVNIRFTIEDEGDGGGEWICQFERGQLVRVLAAHAASGLDEDFGYRSTLAGFWMGISGRHHPQELFLRGHANITGDVERALKMAMILNAFAREFPCDEQILQRYLRRGAAPPACDPQVQRSCA